MSRTFIDVATGKLLLTVPSGGGWQTSITTVGSGAGAVVVDSKPNAGFQSIDYLVTVYNVSNSAYKAFNVKILNANGAYNRSVSNRLNNSGPNISTAYVNNAGTFEFQITNNEAYDIEVSIASFVLT